MPTFRLVSFFEQIVGNLPQQGHVLRRVVLAHPALVFPKGDVEGPVQRVLDTPVAAHRRQQTLGRGLQAADVVSRLDLGPFGRFPAADYLEHRAELGPFLAGAQVFQTLRV